MTITESPQTPPEPTGEVGPTIAEPAAVPVAGPFFERPDWLAFGITTALALTVYLGAMAPEVTLENSGMLATAAAYAGVPHVPGYPLWTLWSWLFSQLLPFSNLAWRVAVASGVAAALASGFAALLVSRGGKLMLEKNPRFAHRKIKEQNLLRLGAGCAAGIGLGLSTAVWQPAVVAETWTFGLLLFAAMLCVFFRWLREPAKRRYLYWAIYLYGALLTGNQELLLVAPALLVIILIGEPRLGRDVYLFFAVPVVIGCVSPGFNIFSLFKSYTTTNVPLVITFAAVVLPVMWAIWKTRRIGTSAMGVVACTSFLLLGLAWYLYLPIASMTNPPMNWDYPRTPDGFLHAISRGEMSAAFPLTSVAQLIRICLREVRRAGDELGWYYLLAAMIPLCVIQRMPSMMRKWMVATFAVFLCAGPLMLATLNPAPERGSWDLIGRYFSYLYLDLAILAGWGLLLLANWCVKLKPPASTQSFVSP